MRTAICLLSLSLMSALAFGKPLIATIPVEDSVPAAYLFSEEVSRCEASLPSLKGETRSYLYEVDKLKPGYVRSRGNIDNMAESFVEQQRKELTSGADAGNCFDIRCRERNVIKKAIFLKKLRKMYPDFETRRENGEACIGVQLLDSLSSNACEREKEPLVFGRVEKSSPAEVAGIKEGDILVKVNGFKLDSDIEFDWVVLAAGVGSTISVDTLHKDKPYTTAMKSGAWSMAPHIGTFYCGR